MKRCNLLLRIFIFSFSCHITAQTDHTKLEMALKNYFTTYTLPDFRPNLPIALDHYEVDEENRKLDVSGNEGFSSQIFTPQTTSKIYHDLSACLPQPYNTYTLHVFAFDREITTLIPNIFQEKPEEKRLWGNLDYKGTPWTKNISSPVHVVKGLEGRHFVVWASHGRYYSYSSSSWTWQRPGLFLTNEDLFTQSFVIPFLIPMLENSGAVVFSPRERDWQTQEVIVNNEDSDSYHEYNRKEYWKDSPQKGFAKKKDIYRSGENPFVEGTARIINATHLNSQVSSCQWTPSVKEEGEYAVYVTYQSFPNSVDDAIYTVHHRGISTKICVNQQMGGSTWVYLGTFNFGKGHTKENSVSLSNASNFRGIVSADAVRFGGGMGNIMRGDSTEGESISGLPRYLEGARYTEQWYGMPDSTYNTKDGRNDYADDINARSLSLNYLGGGSIYMPDSIGQKVPFELSLAVHSDAGVSPDDHVVGTLAIHTLENGRGETFFRSGVSRLASLDFASILQSTVCEDLSHLLQIGWTRRELFNRNYSETRNPEVPSAIIEMFSHQNFKDMIYGHDPNFKFYISRAIYKAILKFVCNQHGTTGVVQPLPVKNFAAYISNNKTVTLSWTPTKDSMEISARPFGYIVYTRKDGEDFNNGTITTDTSLTLPIPDDKICSFKVSAYNEGGLSFPSEILSVMHSTSAERKILIVNGFSRLSGPAIMDTPEQLGFDLDHDAGVPYQHTPEYGGRQINYDRTAAGKNGSNGLGYSGNELEGKMITGNTFDYPYMHGKTIQQAGTFSFSSCSVDAFMNGNIKPEEYRAVDLILGLQKDDGESSIVKYKSFPFNLRNALQNYINNGGNLLVSGSYIASDMQSDKEQQFTKSVLHYAPTAENTSQRDSLVHGNNIEFNIQSNLGARPYAVTHPDRLVPIGGAFPCFTYSDGSCAGMTYADKHSTVIVLGFPFESITSKEARDKLMKSFLQMFQI